MNVIPEDTFRNHFFWRDVKMLQQQVDKQSKTNYVVKIALLSAIATILMFIEFVVPVMPVFLKMDFSEVPVLLGAFALGPVSGIIIELVKNLVHVTSTITGGVGELANFLMGTAFVVPAGLIYKFKKNKKGALLGLVIGILSKTLVAVILNYYVLFPLYQKIFSLDALLEMSKKANPAIHDLKGIIILGIIPFNLLKGFLVSLIIMLIYKKLSPLLHR